MQKSAVLALVAILFSTSHVAFSKTYKVKNGDTLSGIASKEVSRPVYGKKGSLKRVLEMNPEIRNANSIHVDQTIKLSDEEQAVAQEPAAPSETVTAPSDTVVAPSPAPTSPPEEATPAPTAAVVNEEPHFEIGVHGLLSTTSIDASAKDKTFQASPDSKINKGLRLSLGYAWNRSEVELQLGALQSDYAESKDGILEGEEKLLKSFAIAYTHKVSERLRAKASFGSEQVYFLAQKNLTTFDMEAIFIDEVAIGLTYDLYNSQNWTWSLTGNAAYLLAAKGNYVDPDAGYSGMASTDLAYHLSSGVHLETGLFYELRSQDTDKTEQTQDEMGLTLGVRVLF